MLLKIILVWLLLFVLGYWLNPDNTVFNAFVAGILTGIVFGNSRKQNSGWED